MAVTMKEVAREAGVSIATVSKVINKSPSISQATVFRVTQIMKELEYYPNMMAQNFAKRSTHNVTFITALHKNTAFFDPYMFEIMSGLQMYLSNKRYYFTLVNILSEEEQDAVNRIIVQKSADGLVIHSSVLTKEMASQIQKSGIAHAIIGAPTFECQLCWIDTNNYLAGSIAANHILERGFRRIAFVGGPENEPVSSHRLQGAITAMAEKNVLPDGRYIKRGEGTIEDGYRRMEEILSLEEKPDAVICASNYIALGVYKCIHEHHFSIPRDVGVITFDDYPFSQVTEPRMTAVNIDVYDLGIQAGKMILSKIKKPNLQVQSYTTLPNLIIRESTMSSI